MWMAHSHYDKWALFRTQWSPCWVYWTKCSILLCKVIGPINASKSLKKSAGGKKEDSASEEWIFICYLSPFNRFYSLANWVRLKILWEWKFNAGEINFKAPWFMMLQADAQKFSFQRTKQWVLQLCFSLSLDKSNRLWARFILRLRTSRSKSPHTSVQWHICDILAI